MSRTPLCCGLLAIAIGATTLAGCQRTARWPFASEARGRYAGVGIYAPTPQWRQLMRNRRPGSPTAAQLDDDQAILVTTDSSTGELRACGDLSGYCIGLNPWKQPLGAAQTSPVPVAAHGVGLAPDANTADNSAAAAANDAAAAAVAQ